MYKGFNVNIKDTSMIMRYHDYSLDVAKDHYSQVVCKIDSLILNNGKIDGSKLQRTWFPEIDADVFISHSNQDNELAISLMGWLEREFGLKAFIDSCVWGYSNNLLKQIDELYCKTGDQLYSYQSRNFSTAHIHMMLASALTMMIDKTETLFFLNTPQSLSADDIVHETMSAWIYYELITSKYIRKTIPTRLLPAHILSESHKMAKTAAPPIVHTVDITDLITLNDAELNRWQQATKTKKVIGLDALDELYRSTC